VTLVDQAGAPVPDAVVTGTFTGDLSGSDTLVTDASGVAVFLTVDSKKGGVAIEFCVDDVVHAILPYDPAANAETCDVY
jgi:hypothetical protein